MIVQLGYIAKRVNSTKNSTSFTSYQGTLKEACNVLSPAIEFDFGNAPPTGYNYMYIPDFRRFYWVTWEFTGSAHWTAHGKVDVLASAKAEIGTSSKYILRAASEENSEIIDTKYPALTSTKWAYAGANPGFATDPSSGGTYVIGVAGGYINGITGRTGVTYYAMSPSEFQSLMNFLFDTSDMPTQESGGSAYLWQNFKWYIDFTSSHQSLPWKLMINPLQYVTSAIWLPFGVTGISSAVKFGYFETDVQGAESLTTATKKIIIPCDCSSLFTDSSMSDWEYYEPWSNYFINVPFFGMSKVNASEFEPVAGQRTISVTYDVDLHTGAAICTLNGGNGDFAKLSGQVGVTIALGGTKTDYGAIISGAAQTLGGAMSTGMMAASGNPQAILSGFETIRNGVSTALTTCQPVVSTSGSAGSCAGLGDAVLVYRKTLNCAEKNPTEFGYPLCKSKVIASLSGFVQCADGDIESTLTDQEQLEIARYLTEGFFYE